MQSSGSATTASGPAESTSRTLSEAHRARLEERKLNPDLCEHLGVHSRQKAICFDFLADKKIHNTKIRRGKGNMPWVDAGKPLIAWNIDCLVEDPQPDEFVIITEGELDGVSCIQVGFSRVISAPNGAQTGEHGFQWLYKGENIIADLDKFNDIVIATDGDAKGIACRDSLAVRLNDERCRYVVWPDGCKDANDVLMKHGEKALVDVIEAAVPMLIDEVCLMSDVPEPEPETRYRCGIHELDRHGFRITLPAFMPIIGPYASGKSVLLRQLLVSLWQLHGWPALMTSFEERIKPRYQRDLRRHLIGRPSIPDAPWTDEETADADNEISEGFVFLKRKRGIVCDGEWALDRIEYAVKVYGVKVVAIDPFNKIRIRGSNGQNKSDAIGDFLTSLKELGEDYGLLTIVLAHTPKDGTEKRLQKQGFLTLNDGEDSRHWGTDADIGWCVWRDLNGPTMLHLDKLKDHETMGKPTLVEMEHHAAMNEFSIRRMGYEILGDRAAST